jgi:hypothetical protein
MGVTRTGEWEGGGHTHGDTHTRGHTHRGVAHTEEWHTHRGVGRGGHTHRDTHTGTHAGALGTHTHEQNSAPGTPSVSRGDTHMRRHSQPTRTSHSCEHRTVHGVGTHTQMRAFTPVCALQENPQSILGSASSVIHI